MKHFQPKMHQMSFGGLALPGPAGKLTCSPDSWINGSGSLLIREGGMGDLREGRFKGRKGEEGKEGREGKKGGDVRRGRG